MALTEQVILDISRAQSQINQLERQLTVLEQPINIPVNVTGEQAADSLRRELNQADNAVESLNTELAQTDTALDKVGDEAKRTGKELDSAGKKGSTAFSGLRGQIGALAATAAGFIGVAKVTQFLRDSVDAASNFEESLSKTNVVFGEFSQNVEDFASTGATSLGLSTGAALEATATFGNLFTALGLTREAAAELSPEIIQLASDLASFNNTSVDDAITALRSGLVGETEPLRRLGISLNAASVEARALELGLGDATGVVDEAAKVQGRYSLIMEQSVNAQGDFARTADGYANSLKTATAEVENAQVAIGQALIPALDAVLPVLVGAAEGFAVFATEMGGLFGTVDDVTAAFRIFELQTGQGVDTLAGLLTVLRPLNDEVSTLDRDLAGLKDNLDVGGERLTEDLTEFVREAGLGRDALEQLRDEANREFLISIGFDADFLDELLRIMEIEIPAAAGKMVAAINQGALIGFSRLSGGAGNFTKGREAVEQYRAALEELGTPMEQLQVLSDETGFSIGFIAQNAELFGSNVVGLVGGLDAAALASQEFSAAMSEVAGSITFDVGDAVDELELLVTKTNEAGEEIPQSVRQMNEQLRADANTLADIEAGTLLLDALGLTSLADEIRSLPTEDAKLAIDKYLADAVGAVEADRILAEGGNPGDEIVQLINEQIAAGNLTEGMLDFVATMTSESTQLEILNQALVFSDLTEAAFKDALDALDIEFTPTIRANLEGFLFTGEPPPGFVPPTRPPPPRGDAGQGGDTGLQGNVTVIQNFNTDNVNSTETERAAAEINSIVALVPR